MNIWYVHPYGGGPGIGRFYRPYHLAKEWEKLGHRTTVFVADFHHLLDRRETLAPRQMVDGVPYVALEAGEYQGNGMGRILNMARFCRSLWRTRKRVGVDLDRPDAIIVSSPHPFAIYPARAIAKRLGAKLAFEVRDLWPLSITEINGTSRWHPFVLLTAFTERYAYRHADLVASLLPGVETYIRERGMAYKRFVWVPNGVVAQINPTPPSSAEGLRLLQLVKDWKSQGKRIIIHPGSMGPPNAIDLLIDATTLLNRQRSCVDIGVLLVGSGISRSALEEKVWQLGLDNVVFGGPIPKHEAQYITAQCDIGYCGGRGHENVYQYGISFNKIMDFIHAGLPMVLPFRAAVVPDQPEAEEIHMAESSAQSICNSIVGIIDPQFNPVVPRSSLHASRLRDLFHFSTIAERYAASISALPEKESTVLS